MDSSHIPLIIAIVILIVGSAYFSATETAFSSLNRIRMKNMAADGNKRAQLALDMADRSSALDHSDRQQHRKHLLDLHRHRSFHRMVRLEHRSDALYRCHDRSGSDLR